MVLILRENPELEFGCQNLIDIDQQPQRVDLSQDAKQTTNMIICLRCESIMSTRMSQIPAPASTLRAAQLSRLTPHFPPNSSRAVNYAKFSSLYDPQSICERQLYPLSA